MRRKIEIVPLFDYSSCALDNTATLSREGAARTFFERNGTHQLPRKGYFGKYSLSAKVFRRGGELLPIFCDRNYYVWVRERGLYFRVKMNHYDQVVDGFAIADAKPFEEGFEEGLVYGIPHGNPLCDLFSTIGIGCKREPFSEPSRYKIRTERNQEWSLLLMARQLEILLAGEQFGREFVSTEMDVRRKNVFQYVDALCAGQPGLGHTLDTSHKGQYEPGCRVERARNIFTALTGYRAIFEEAQNRDVTFDQLIENNLRQYLLIVATIAEAMHGLGYTPPVVRETKRKAG